MSGRSRARRPVSPDQALPGKHSTGKLRSGLLLHSGGAVVTRMFVPETRGVAFPRDRFAPEDIFARLDEILDEAGYRTPVSTDDVGISSRAMVSARDAIVATD